MQLPTWNSLSSPQMTRTTVIVAAIAISTLMTVAGAGYYTYRTYVPRPTHVGGPGLHRSNAVRRRRRSRGLFDDSRAPIADDDNPEADVDTLQILHDGETIVDDPDVEDDWWNDPSAMPTHQRAGQNIVSLLFRVSEDNARRNACIHRGCACNGCGAVPIRGIRYRCANCADFDLCESCEAQGMHNKTHIFYKVKVPAPPFGPRSIQPVWYPGDPDQCLQHLPKALILKLSRETGFEWPELDAFWEQWTFMANTEWRDDPDELNLAMDRKTFERCLTPSGGYRHAAPNLIHDRMFAFYDTNRDGLIGFTEFLHGLSYRKRRDKLKKIFEGYDIDGDGLVNRRDFLRMFRAYYVLYKQMHRDILEGLDDQVMSSNEAQQLVAGRQPLSSLYARDTRVPNGDPSRHVEGKVYERNGDVTLTDERPRVVNEDSQDTAPRDEILSALFSREAPRMQTLTYELSTRSRRDSNPNYWEGLLDTPRQVSDLPQLLLGGAGELSEIFDQVAAAMSRLPSDTASSRSSDEENHEAPSANGEYSANGDNRRNDETSGDNGAEDPPTQGEDTGHEELELARMARSEWTSLRMETRMGPHFNKAERRRRDAARRQLHERWKRRQFYLDEEEGGRAPVDWDSEEDVLENQHHEHEEVGNGESSKSAQRPTLSPRSRSSSKVRFAEDMGADDYEIRSNPSTSSRSVPERWGGFEIPEAERDAGKEVLYQVTQQAFNELLDILFKEKEDMAIRCAETAEERAKWRKLSREINLKDEDLQLKGERVGGDSDKRENKTKFSRRHGRHWGLLENGNGTQSSDEVGEDPFTDGYRNPEEQTLDELLSATGFSINNPDEDGEKDADDEAVEHESRDEEHQPFHNGHGDGLEGYAPSSITGDDEPVAHRDPTMPQFRPNTLADIRPQAHFADRAVVLSPDSQEITIALPLDSSPSRPETELPALPSDEDSENSSARRETKRRSAQKTNGNGGKGKEKSKNSKGKKPVTWDDTAPSQATLAEYRRLDIAAEECGDRGGWGKLNFSEFEEIYKRQEMDGNRLDYLGTWIDFCIP